MSEQRKYYRIMYPEEFRPVFEYVGGKCDVYDVSEKGLRVAADDTKSILFRDGAVIRGVVRFSDGVGYEVEGKITRAVSGSSAIALKNRIPFSRIMSEQRLLIKRFGKERVAKGF
jgi:fructose-bisphosphate aldolase class 1